LEAIVVLMDAISSIDSNATKVFVAAQAGAPNAMTKRSHSSGKRADGAPSKATAGL